LQYLFFIFGFQLQILFFGFQQLFFFQGLGSKLRFRENFLSLLFGLLNTNAGFLEKINFPIRMPTIHATRPIPINNPIVIFMCNDLVHKKMPDG